MSNKNRAGRETRRKGETKLPTQAQTQTPTLTPAEKAAADGEPRYAPTTRVGRWVEARSGLLGGFRRAFNPPVPRASRFRYALGAALVSSLVVEFITGLLLMCSYSPSSTTAWGSTFYIHEVLAYGWFVRGLHNFAAHAMIIVSAFHLASVVVSGVYRAPREVNWWIGLATLGVLVVFTLTGNALTWDQDGYWAWNVETGIAGGMPYFGPILQRLVVGGTELGNATLGRLYALHVGLLPVAMIFLLQAHILLARRHARSSAATGLIACDPAWPGQVFANTLASVAMLGVIAGAVVYYHGAALDAPGDPSSQYPARPAWFFLWLFDMRKHFLGPKEFIATMVIPGALATTVFLMPFFDRVLPRKFAHFVAVAFSFAFIGAAGYLTVNSLRIDAADPHYRESVEAADAARDRAIALARLGIPPEGASALLGRDPLFHGRAVLDGKCLGCHSFDGKVTGEAQTAPDLKGYGSRAWLRGLLENPGSDAYFGKVPQCEGMVGWRKSTKLTSKELDDVADFVALFADVPDDVTPEEWLETPGLTEHRGYTPFVEDCGKCHAVPGLTEGGAEDAPGLFAYGSPQWTRRIILKPGASNLYGYLEKDAQMPAFSGQLTPNDLDTLVRYLRNDYPGAPGQPRP